MVDAIGLFLSLFSHQVWQLNFCNTSADRPNSKLQYVAVIRLSQNLQSTLTSLVIITCKQKKKHKFYSVSKMTYFTSSGTLNLRSINQSTRTFIVHYMMLFTVIKNKILTDIRRRMLLSTEMLWRTCVCCKYSTGKWRTLRLRLSNSLTTSTPYVLCSL